MNISSDSETTVSELRERVQKFIDDRDWNKYHNPKDLTISIAIEASELMELFQWVKENEVTRITNDSDKLGKLEEELADVMIYCLSLANALDIDVAQAIDKKISKNESKYPVEQVRGDYKKYIKSEGDKDE